MTFRLVRFTNFRRQCRGFFASAAIRNEENIIVGPEPQHRLPNVSLGRIIFEKLSTPSGTEPALEDAVTQESISSREIFEKSVSLARCLRKHGFDKEPRLAVCSDNNLRFFVPIIASLFVGVPVIFINPMYSCMEKIHCLNETKPELVFSSKSSFSELETLKTKFRMDYIKKIVTIDSSDFESFIENENIISKHGDILVDVDPEEDLAFVLFTAGTTGLPKAVELTHQNIIIEFFNFMDSRFYFQGEDTPHLGVLPFCHGYGIVASLFDLVMKKPIVILRSYSAEVIFKTVLTYQIKRLWVGPFVFNIIAHDPIMGKYDLSILREFGSSGSFLGPCTDQELKKKFTNAKVRQSFSLTETTSGVLVNDYEQPICGSCGKVVPRMACKIVDVETNEALEAYRVGKMYFKGPMIMKRYYKRGAPLEDQWFYSGDLGYYDYDKNFFFVSRTSDIINFENQLLIEDVLLAHPEIDDAGVVGLPSKESGQLPFAFVVKSANSKLNKTDVVLYIREQLLDPMWLRGGVVFITKIPRSNFGKIRRHELRRFLEFM